MKKEGVSTSFSSAQTTKQLALSELDKGRLYFEQICIAINKIPQLSSHVCSETISDVRASSCLAVSNCHGECVFLRFDYFKYGSWGGQPEFRIGFYVQPDALCPLRWTDDQLILMNSHRGENGFKARFDDFVQVFIETNNALALSDVSVKKLVL